MPLIKEIKDKESTSRYKSGNENQRLLTASARNAKENEFFEQKKKREAERKAAQERIKKAQGAIASRNSGAGVGSSVNSGKGNSPVTRAAMNAPSGSDDVSRAGDGGHNRANDNKGNQPITGNLGRGSSSFSAMLAGLAEENERRSGTGGHNRAGENDSRGQRFSDSAQRSSAIPSSSLSNELDFSDDDKNKSWSKMLDELQSQRRKPDTANGKTSVKENTKTYNSLDEVHWRDAQDALVYEDMKNGWKPGGEIISAIRRPYIENNIAKAEDTNKQWSDFTSGQIPIPDLTQFDNVELQTSDRNISKTEVFIDKVAPGILYGTMFGGAYSGLLAAEALTGTVTTGVAEGIMGSLGASAVGSIEGEIINEFTKIKNKSSGPSETMEIIARSEDQGVTITYTATKYSEGGMDMLTTIKADGVAEPIVTWDYYPYDSFGED